jgi:hypothetical protein
LAKTFSPAAGSPAAKAEPVKAERATPATNVIREIDFILVPFLTPTAAKRPSFY